MNRFVQGLLPSRFEDEWPSNVNRNLNHNYVFRNQNDLFLPLARTAYVQKSPYYSFPKAWLDFDCNDIKIQRNKIALNFKLKKIFH